MGRTPDIIGELNDFVAEEFRSLKAISGLSAEEISVATGISLISVKRALGSERTITMHYLESFAAVFGTTSVDILISAEARRRDFKSVVPKDEVDVTYLLKSMSELRIFLKQNPGILKKKESTDE